MTEPLRVSWHSFDLKSGRRGPELTVQSLGSVKRAVGEASDADLQVRCYDVGLEPVEGRVTTAGVIPGWDAGTLPGRAMIVALDQFEQPLWAGMVVRRRSDAGEWVTVDMATLEAYFDRRYVTDHDFTQTAQGAIVESILTADLIPTGISFIVDSVSAFVRDRTYADDEDKTVLSVLQELMGVEAGPEFTVDLEWADDTHTVLNRVVRVRDRIGVAAPLPVEFTMPGAVTSFEFVEDYTKDNGGNDIMATSSGEGDARPESAHAVAQAYLDGGWARYEMRYSPSTSITETNTLDAHAVSTLAEVKDGLNELTFEVHLDNGPRFGTDYHLGDDVTVALTCPRFPERVGPDLDLIPGFTKRMRCIAIELDFDGRRAIPTCVEVVSGA